MLVFFTLFNLAAAAIFLVIGALWMMALVGRVTDLSSGSGLINSAFFLVLSAIGVVIGIGLWKSKKWVNNMLLLFAPVVLGIIYRRLVGDTGWLVEIFGLLNMGVFLYLSWAKVKEAFGFESQEGKNISNDGKR